MYFYSEGLSIKVSILVTVVDSEGTSAVPQPGEFVPVLIKLSTCLAASHHSAAFHPAFSQGLSHV